MFNAKYFQDLKQHIPKLTSYRLEGSHTLAYFIVCMGVMFRLTFVEDTSESYDEVIVSGQNINKHI